MKNNGKRKNKKINPLNPINNANKKIIIIFDLIIFFLYMPLSIENVILRKLVSIEQIIITVKGIGEKAILNFKYNYPPDEVIINGNAVGFSYTEGNTENYKFQLDLEKNIISLNYNSCPITFKNMFAKIDSLIKVDLSKIDTTNVNDMSQMFSECILLEEIYMKGLKTSSVTTMDSMFQNCKALTSIDLSNFDTSSVLSMKYMFYFCETLNSIDVSNFDTSKVKDMDYMFFALKMIKTLDVSNFIFDDVKMYSMFKQCLRLVTIIFPKMHRVIANDIGSMLQDCKALKSVDLSSFDTSKVTNMGFLFDNCYQLFSVDLSSFDTSKVEDFTSMFAYCADLKSLDLSNFRTNSAKSMKGMFAACQLKYLNIKSFEISENTEIDYMFRDFFDNAKICFDLDNAGKITSLNNNLKNKCEDNCFNSNYKLIIETSTCIENCLNDENYKYEYNNICYSKCPSNTVEKNNICEDILICSYYNLDKTKCFDNIPVGYYLFNKEEKTIDKCYEKCKTCSKNGTEDNNECLTCEGSYYLYNGNCLDNCPHGFYYDTSGNLVCSCLENEKCKECTEESLMVDLCVSCNDGFQEIKENGNNFVSCHEEIEGYYIDQSDSTYKKCYSTCKKCSGGGDENNHNCDTCIDDYVFLEILNKEKNCYRKCENYYYLISENEISCTDECLEKNILKDNICIYLESSDEENTQLIETEKEIDIQTNKETDTQTNKEIETQTIRETDFPTIKEIYTQTNKETDSPTNKETDFPTNKETDSPTNKETVSPTNKETDSPNIKETDSPTNKEIDAQTTKETDSPTNKETDSPTNKETDAQTTKETDNPTSKITDSPTIKTTNNPNDITTKSDDWSVEKFLNGLYDNVDIDNNLSNDNILDSIREGILNHDLESLISNVIEEKQDKCITSNNVLYQITTSENQNNNIYNNISSIKLGKCEDILKNIYKIDSNETLIILKIEYYKTGLLIPIIRYEVFNPKNYSKLNLSYCNESLINYNIPVSIDENNLDKYDPTSEYYNDECNAYTTENGTDILLSDRKNEFIENNMSLCENICEYSGYDKEKKKVICQCSIKYREFIISEIEKESNLLNNNLTVEESNSNMVAMKCFEFLFTKEGLLSNLGNYILLFIILFHCISIIIFYKCGYHIIDGKIRQILGDKKKSKSIKSKKDCNIFDLDKKSEQSKKNTLYSVSSKKKKLKKKKKISENPPKKSTKKKIKQFINSQEKNITNNNNKSINRSNNQLNLDPKVKIKQRLNLKNKSHKFFKLNENKNSKNNIVSFIVSDYNDSDIDYKNYKDAIIFDKRTFGQIYISFLFAKQPILFSFCPKNDYNIFIIKLCLFFLSFAIYYSLNTFFFDLSVIHKIYEDNGEYNLSYHFPQIIFSFLISYYVNNIIKFVTLIERNLLKIKYEKSINEANEKSVSIKKCCIIKGVVYFILSISVLIFIWYYLSSFCAVYQNSQIFLIKNTFISFTLGLIFPFIAIIFPLLLRIFSLKNKNGECIYKLSIFFQII